MLRNFMENNKMEEPDSDIANLLSKLDQYDNKVNLEEKIRSEAFDNLENLSIGDINRLNIDEPSKSTLLRIRNRQLNDPSSDYFNQLLSYTEQEIDELSCSDFRKQDIRAFRESHKRKIAMTDEEKGIAKYEDISRAKIFAIDAAESMIRASPNGESGSR